MKHTISASSLYWNKNLMNFFFREQAEETFEKVMDCIDVRDKETALDIIDNYYEELDDCEEDFYTMSADDIIAMLGLPVYYDEDDEEEEDGDE